MNFAKLISKKFIVIYVLTNNLQKYPFHHMFVNNKNSHLKATKTRLTFHALKVVSHCFNMYLGGHKWSGFFVHLSLACWLARARHILNRTYILPLSFRVTGFPVQKAKGQSNPLTLWDPRLCSPSDSSVHGVLQARILERLPFPSPGDLLNPGTEPESPTLKTDSLPSEPAGKPGILVY